MAGLSDELLQTMDPRLRRLFVQHRFSSISAIANIAAPGETLEDIWTEVTSQDAQFQGLYDNFTETVQRARAMAARKRRQDAAAPYVTTEAKRRGDHETLV